MQTILLNDGVSIPTIGFGTYKSTTENGYQTIVEAIELGYRLIDTAKLYQNEEDVGRAIRACSVPRSELFITSKLDRNAMGYEATKREFTDSLRRLGTDYLDLYLLHWPRAAYGHPDFDNWKELGIGSWRALEELKAEGKIRSIGVSNFLPHHLLNLLENTSTVPSVNQLELHPGYMQAAACEFCRQHGIALEAWSPIGRQRMAQNKILMPLAEKYHTTVAHLCLVYLHTEGIIVIPKTTHADRMKENMMLDDIRLTEEELWLIRTMPQDGWGGEHPDMERIWL